MSIQAILMDAGHIIQTEYSGAKSAQQTWWSANLRPDLTPQTLPEIGDSYTTTGQATSGQAIIYGSNSLVCKRIQEAGYLADDHTAGTVYTVYYDNTDERIFHNPTDDDDVVVMSISSGVHTDSYEFDPSTDKVNKIYININGSWEETDTPLPLVKVNAVTNISTTKRYRTSAQNIINLGNLAGYTNGSSMWGEGAGNIMYNGISAQPLQEVVDSVVTISWNVTNSYTIKYIPGINSDTWNYCFYKGKYSRVSTEAGTGGIIDMYPKANIPNDLT